MPNNVTVYQVASDAKVSPSTVSRVINGTAQVTEDKHRAVTESIRKLGYQPNMMAKGLSHGKTLSIGVVTQQINSPYYGEILRGIELGLVNSMYFPIIASGQWRVQRETEALQNLISRHVDALIVLDCSIEDQKLQELSAKLPVLVVGKVVESMAEMCVDIDQIHAGTTGTHHLLQLGHRRIAHLTGPFENKAAADRHVGYLHALKAFGVEMDPALIIAGEFTEKSGYEAMNHLLDNHIPFTAVLAGNDQMAYGARLALYRRGLRVPQDVSLVGFDDLPGCPFMIPPLTTVRLPTVEFGQELARVMLLRLNKLPYRWHKFSAHLMARESTTALI